MSVVEIVRRHPLAAYVAVTLTASWAVAAPLVLAAQGQLTSEPPRGLHYAYSFGPAIGAVVVTSLIAGRAGLADLWRRVTRWRIGARWVLVAVLSPLALLAVGSLASRAVTGEWPDLTRLGDVNFLGNIGLWVVPLWIVTYGFGEEIGWRGFALPQIQRHRSALSASLVVATIWMAWHIPAFFYLPTYRELGAAMIPAFFIGVALGSVLLTWLYNGSGGSIFAVAMWHALWDLVSASKAADPTSQAAMTTLISLWAIAIVWRARRTGLGQRVRVGATAQRAG